MQTTEYIVDAQRTKESLQGAAKNAEFTVNCTAQQKVFNWWNSDCCRDYRRRKAALRTLLHNHCHVSWINYKYISAVFKRTVAKAKMDYIKNLNDSLSNSKNNAALYKFMASNRAVSINELVIRCLDFC